MFGNCARGENVLQCWSSMGRYAECEFSVANGGHCGSVCSDCGGDVLHGLGPQGQSGSTGAGPVCTNCG